MSQLSHWVDHVSHVAHMSDQCDMSHGTMQPACGDLNAGFLEDEDLAAGIFFKGEFKIWQWGFPKQGRATCSK